MAFRTPKATVRGYGTGHSGTHHWWAQRITSVALIPLTFLFAIPFVGALGDGYEGVIALYSHPFHAIVAALFLAVTFHHHAQGLQVVIEDYIHHRGWRTVALLGNVFLCFVLGFAGVFAVLKIAFTG
ncbi:MAG: succinate dehydrogenase, hydrophobic membrane anchor protein [Pseudomonadota bacterium]